MKSLSQRLRGRVDVLRARVDWLNAKIAQYGPRHGHETAEVAALKWALDIIRSAKPELFPPDEPEVV